MAKGLRKSGNKNNVKNNESAVKPENKAAAFLHWSMLGKDGETVILKDDKGIAIFQNPKYQSDAEDRLIQLAELQENNEITFDMRVTIRLNKKKHTAMSADELLAALF